MQDTQETWVQSLGQEDPLEKGMATHSSILAWRTPWTEELGWLQSMGSWRVRHTWAHVPEQEEGEILKVAGGRSASSLWSADLYSFSTHLLLSHGQPRRHPSVPPIIMMSLPQGICTCLPGYLWCSAPSPHPNPWLILIVNLLWLRHHCTKDIPSDLTLQTRIRLLVLGSN